MGRRRKPWAPGDVNRLVKMRRDGKTWREIGAALGKPHISCARYWREVLGYECINVEAEGGND
ncbi:hypothetical protein J2D73_19560 [Acetobacter sacchari]|uniref:Myb-like domain-containing protein n=1 Tax=Acetobacter sacchari TaxID=2661687 RepID=A0ABS3M1G2_9PROT|nr:hypothetical protein [Acetobacter sacchari]MBO1361983.1 hypothetical protein [Acetobacter sacchari]